MTTVVHVNDGFDTYIGRACRGRFPASKWANPFRIGRDGNRLEVILQARNWLITQLDLMASLHELKDKRLGCWCHPKACHGDFLAALVNEVIK